MTFITPLAHIKPNIFNNIILNKIMFFLSWFLCFSIALPHTILPGKAGAISLSLFILWLAEGNLKIKIQILFTSKLFLSLLGFILILSLSMLWTKQVEMGLLRLSIYKYYIFLIPVLITSITQYQALKLIHAFVLGNILHATLMVLLSYGVLSNLPSLPNLYNPYSIYAPFFVFSSFYCFYFFRNQLNKKNIIRSLIYLFLSLALAYIIFINKGRSGHAAFIFSALLTLFLLHDNWKKTIIFFSITTALLIMVIISSPTVKSTYIAAINEIKQIEKDNYQGSWGARWGLLVTNYKIIKKNPILGVGLGSTYNEMKKITKQSKNPTIAALTFFDIAHNHYITTITSAGLIGLILYLLIHFYIFRLPIKQKEIKYLSLIFLAIFITNSITDDILLYKPYNIYFAIMIALFINLSLDEKDKKNIEPDKKL